MRSLTAASAVSRMECVSTTTSRNKQTTKRRSRKRGITALLHDATNLGVGEIIDHRVCKYKAAECMQQFSKKCEPRGDSNAGTPARIMKHTVNQTIDQTAGVSTAEDSTSTMDTSSTSIDDLPLPHFSWYIITTNNYSRWDKHV